MRGRLLTTLLVLLGVACRVPGGGEGDGETLRVLSYNIHHGEGVDGRLDLKRIADLIERSGADLVALQELDREAQRTGGVDQLEVLAGLTGMQASFASFMDFQGGQYGLGILSRHSIQRSWTIELPPGQHEPRSAAAIEVELPGRGLLTFVCLHLDWLQDDEVRLSQASSLLDALAEVDGPVVVAGDFNDVIGSRTMELVMAEFTNAGKPAGASATFSARDPQQEIDFVMYRSTAIISASARTLHEPDASDHLPVLAELR